ncbi:MAG: hypothetical protein U0805_02675 [Pirellulales bacterium]
MCNVEFKFSVQWPPEFPRPLSGFELGDLTITGSNGTVTSGSDPRMSMMVFLSCTLLLDGVRAFFTNRTARTYRFGAIDSSFGILFARNKEQRIVISVDEQCIAVVSPKMLQQALLLAADDLLTTAFCYLPEDDTARRDLKAATALFKTMEL